MLDGFGFLTDDLSSRVEIKRPYLNPMSLGGPIWGSNGFDIVQNETDASRGCLVGLVKLSRQKLNANESINMAPSLAEADAILAEFGYVDTEAVAFAV